MFKSIAVSIKLLVSAYSNDETERENEGKMHLQHLRQMSKFFHCST